VSETDSSIFDFLDVSFLAIVVFPAPDGEEITIKTPFFFTFSKNYLAAFSTKLIASPTVNIFSASLSEISAPSHFTSDTIVIGNLPYNISLKLLIKWIYQYPKKPWFKKMILMFQKEVAERIISDENSKKYGRITLITSSLFRVSKILDVCKDDFFPVPKVDSALLLFEPLQKPHLNLKNIKKLEFLSNNLFSSRRKKLKNKIESLYDAETIEKNNLKNYFDLRAENLDRDTFFSLVKLLK